MGKAEIARLAWAGARIAHCRFPAWEVGERVSISEPSSVAVAFTTQRRATVEVAGTTRERDVRAWHVGLVGQAPVSWLRVNEPSELIEITASPEVRHSVAAELGAIGWADLDEVESAEDVVVWSVATRFRSALRGGAPLQDVERDTLVRLLYRRVLESIFGASRQSRGRAALDSLRLRRVTDFVEAHVDEELSLDRLANVAALSPFHFLRSFRAATGVSPHRFVTMRRMERAQQLLLFGQPLKQAAVKSGFRSQSWFAAAFIDHFGYGPTQIPRRSGSEWA